MAFAVYVKLKLSNEIGFFQEFLRKNHLLRAYYLRLDWSGWPVLNKSEILITTGMVWPVSSHNWVNYVPKMFTIFQQRSFRFRIRDLKPSYHGRALLSYQYVTGYVTAVYSVVTQCSWGGTLRDDTKSGCVAD